MDFQLTAEQQEFRAWVRALAEEKIRPLAAQYDREERFPEEQIKALGEAGLLAMLAPKEFGGGGYGSFLYSLAITEVARCCASTSVTMAVTNMVCDAICAWGNDEQKHRYIPKLASAEYSAGSFCLSETGAGSDAASLKSTAIKNDGNYVINGSKAWITSGDKAGVLLIMAKTDLNGGSRGISAFLVEPEMQGFSVGKHEEKMGLRASSTVTINMDDLEVPESARIGPEGIGFKIAMRALDGGRIGIGSQALGIAQAAFEAATKYSQEHPDKQTQAFQWKLADMANQIDAARLLVLRAATMKDKQIPFGKEASMAKVYSTEVANKVASEAIQIIGPEAYDKDFGVERLYRDVRITTIYEGTSEIQRFVIARNLLAEA